jgi:hypothetical protein
MVTFWLRPMKGKELHLAQLFDFIGSPNGSRTRVLALRGLCPGPLDDGTLKEQLTVISEE